MRTLYRLYKLPDDYGKYIDSTVVLEDPDSFPGHWCEMMENGKYYTFYPLNAAETVSIPIMYMDNGFVCYEQGHISLRVESELTRDYFLTVRGEVVL